MRRTTIATFLRACGAFDSSHPDERLLADFFANRDEEAFAALVRRHQQTVWGVCKRVLANNADAEDAFQATFLVLVCRGRTLADRGSIGGWLYRVAYRTALKARNMANKRRQREASVATADGGSPVKDDSFELVSIVGEELDRLPKQHRMAVIVSDLDGLSRAEAAVRLGCSEGTLSARLHRGRKQLAERLNKRGVAAPTVGIGALLALATPVPAAAGPALVELATSVAVLGISNRAVSASVAALVLQTTREMTMRFTTKVLATLLLTTGLVGGSIFGWNVTPNAKVNAAPIPAVKEEVKVELSGPAYDLIRHRKVLKELKCTAEQRVQIEDAFEDLDEKRPAQGIPLQINPGNANNPQAIQQQIEARNQKMAEASQAEAKEIAGKYLGKEQLARLGQIELQSQGVKAFADEKLVETLKLTDTQKKLVRDTIEELNAPVANRPAPAGFGGGRAGGVPVVIQGFAGANAQPDAKKRAEAMEKVVGSFSKEQEQVWKKMTGDKIGFDLPARKGFAGGAVRIGGGGFGVQALPAQPIPAPAPVEKPKD